MKNGEFVDTYDRDRRVNREKSREKLDLEMIGLVKKRKKSNPATKENSVGC
jgi:ATP-dependent RNA helicase CshB